MNLKISYLTCIISISFLIQSFGQKNTISGRVLSVSDNTPLTGAHVFLVKEPDSIKMASLTDAAGRFAFSNIKPDRYVIKVSFIGYHTLSKNIKLENEDIVLNDLKLRPELKHIKEVEVKGSVPTAKQVGDTTQYNADAFKVTSDATAEDLIEKMPGIVVDDGKVEAQGEDVKKVLVDGRPFFGNDPTAALRILPAEVIDKIQVFDKKSDQSEFTGFDDGETSKTLNLITKPTMRNGIFGKIYSGYGNEDKYTAGGNINIFKGDRRITFMAQSNNISKQNFANEDLIGIMASGRSGRRGGMSGGRGGGRDRGGRGGGRNRSSGGGNVSDFLVPQQRGITKTHAFGLNYSDKWGKKINTTASYFFNFSDNDAFENLNREYISASELGKTYVEKDVSKSENINHRFNMKFEYNINENNTILLRPSFSMQKNNGYSDLFGQTNELDSILNNTSNFFESDYSAINLSNNLLYRHKFGRDRRTFSINLNTNYNDKTGESNLLSESNYFTGELVTDDLDQIANLFADGIKISTNIMYTEPIGETGMLQLNYSTSYKKNESDKRSFNYNELQEIYNMLDTSLSNTFYNDYNTHQVGLGYMLRKNKLNVTTRLSVQRALLDKSQLFPTEEDINREFDKILGRVILRYRFANKQNLNIVYRTSTNPPSTNQLQEVIDNSNPLQLKTGNADLDQTYQHSLFARFSSIKNEKSKVFFALLGGSYTSNYIGNSTFFADQDTLLANGIFLQEGSQLSMPVNLNNSWSIRSFITYGLPVYNPVRVNLNFNISANYSRTPGLINNEINYAENTGLNFNIVLSSNISEKIDFTLSSRNGVNFVNNSLTGNQNSNYFSQNTKFRFKWITWKNVVLESNLSNRKYSGLSSGYNQNYWIWNVGIGKKVLKNQLGEIKLSVYDILNQNSSIKRTVSDIYIEDTETYVLQSYAMLSFTYNIRSFKGGGMNPEDFQRKRGIPGRQYFMRN